jgi:hypothetical protein
MFQFFKFYLSVLPSAPSVSLSEHQPVCFFSGLTFLATRKINIFRLRDAVAYSQTLPGYLKPISKMPIAKKSEFLPPPLQTWYNSTLPELLSFHLVKKWKFLIGQKP